MPYLLQNIGDNKGEGHDLNLAHIEDGTVILYSRNPDTGETQRIVLLQNQWQILLRFLLETYGTDKCHFHNPEGLCRGAPERNAA